ncbi:MAG: acyl-CoA dehydrogenase family protein [Haloechinothrix sp.]
MTHDLLSLPTDEFIANIDAVAKTRLDCRTYPQQNLPAEDWGLLVKAGVLLPALPKEYGGRDSHLEMCRVVETLAEHNLPVGMCVKIITAVALRPIAMRASEQAKREVLPLFAADKPMICGFASTEPGCGSAMSSMRTTYEEVDGGYRIRKTLAGLQRHRPLVAGQRQERHRRPEIRLLHRQTRRRLHNHPPVRAAGNESARLRPQRHRRV